MRVPLLNFNRNKGDGMKRLTIVILALVALVSVLLTRVTAAPTLQYRGEVSSPRSNAVLRGQVAVEGTADHPEFWKYEVRVAPGLNPQVSDDQWFRINVREERVIGGQLAVWNTASFPDGVYTLRLRVVRRDGNWQDFDVRPLSISNAAPPTAIPPTPIPPTPIPQDTPTPLASPTLAVTFTPVVIETATPEGSPTPTETPTPEVSPTPQVIPTLEASTNLTPSPGGSPSPEQTVEGATPLPTSPAGNGTAIVVAQPTIIVPTASVFPAGGAGVGEEETFPTPSAGDSGIPLPSLEGFEVRGLATSCLMGITFTVGIFVVLGLLYFVRSLVRLFR